MQELCPAMLTKDSSAWKPRLLLLKNLDFQFLLIPGAESNAALGNCGG